jgi:glycosyltransferase involved in cell wall biosynthesis
MKSKVVIYTHAYNAEKTIRRTIESVLNQTYKNFVYYLLDNGSTDSTRDIMYEYTQDKRIVVLENDKNNFIYRQENLQRYTESGFEPHWLFEKNVIWNDAYSDDDFYCVLDADDEYLPSFFEDMLNFCHSHNLEFASCGNETIRESDGMVIDRWKVSEDLIITNGKDYDLYFEDYSKLISTLWSLFIKFSVLRKANLNIVTQSLIDFCDTAISFFLLKHSNNLGISPKILHRYYIHEHNMSRTFHIDLFERRLIGSQAAYDFLGSKVRYISVKTENCLSIKLYVIIFNCLRFLVESKESTEFKVKTMLEMLETAQVKQLREKLIKGNVFARNDLTSLILPISEFVQNINDFDTEKTVILKSLEDFTHIKRGEIS